MKLTKYMQACVLVEDQSLTVLFDPDNFTWNSGSFSLDSISRLDYVCITHVHSDHYSSDFVGAIFTKFPDANYVTNEEVAEKLRSQGIHKIITESNNVFDIVDAPHEDMEPLLGHPNNQNVAITYDNKVTHTGDSFQLEKAAPLLLLAIDGPWGSTADAAKLIKKLKPKYVFPIHDAMYTDKWREMSYGWIEFACKQNGATLVKPIVGRAVEVGV